MSNFNRWWSRRTYDPSEHKEFAREVWTEAAKPYQESIASLSVLVESMAKSQKVVMKAFNEQTKEVKQLREALGKALDEAQYEAGFESFTYKILKDALQRAGGGECYT